MRASIYGAAAIEGVATPVDYVAEFENNHG